MMHDSKSGNKTILKENEKQARIGAKTGPKVNCSILATSVYGIKIICN